MLAAARGQGAAPAASAPAAPQATTAPVAKPAVAAPTTPAQAAPAQAAAPTGEIKKIDRSKMSVAEMLAYARQADTK